MANKLERTIGTVLLIALSLIVGAILAYRFVIYDIDRKKDRVPQMNSTGFTTHDEVELGRCLEGLDFEYPCPTDLKVINNHGLVETYNPQGSK